MTPPEAPALEYLSRSVEQTLALGRRLASVLRQGDVVGLSGQLGAGKTQLVRGVAAGFGVDPRCVSSPTFVLMCEYSGGPGGSGQTPVVHIDAYRMQGLSDLESIGWGEEMWAGAVTVIEWADRIAGHLPPDHLWITLEHRGETERAITMEPRGEFRGRMDMLREAIGIAEERTPCPTCKQPVATTAESYPFCSSRCRMVDLNKWFTGSYRIGTPLHELEDDSDLE